MSVTTESPPALKRKEFRADVPFVKAATSKTGDIELVGYANTWIEDRDGDIVDPRAFDESLPEYLEKNPIVLLNHDLGLPLGSVAGAETDQTGLKVTATIPKPSDGEIPEIITAYNKIAAGILRTFSIGGFMTYDIQDGALIIRSIELFEISVVSIPANCDSLFEATIKAARDQREQPPRRVSDQARSQMKQLLGLEPVSDPDLVAMNDDQRAARHVELSGLYEAADVDPPDFDSWQVLEQKIVSLADDPLAQAKVVPEVFELMKRASGDVPLQKRGRAISQANETKLRDAMDLHQQGVDMHTKGIDMCKSVLDALANDRGTTDDVGQEDDGPPQ